MTCFNILRDNSCDCTVIFSDFLNVNVAYFKKIVCKQYFESTHVSDSCFRICRTFIPFGLYATVVAVTLQLGKISSVVW